MTERPTLPGTPKGGTLIDMEGAVVWLTGIPATGKTTVARILKDELTSRDVPTMLLDSDVLRSVMLPSPSGSDEERDAVYATLGHVAELAAEGGSVVVVAATAPKRRYRDRVRQRVESFVEVLLICDPEMLALRSQAFSKLELPYEDPRDPELIFDSGRTSATEIAMAILRLLQKRSERHHHELVSHLGE